MPDSIPSQVVPQAVATQEELPKPEPLVEHQQQEDKQEGEGEGEAPLAPVEQAAVDPIVPSNQLKPRSLTSRPPPLPPPLPTQDKVLPSPSRPTTRSSAQQANPNNTAATSAAQGALDDDDDEGGKSNWVKGTKSRWSPEEDKELLRIIQESPTLSWEDIAGKMEGRKASGCAMRWSVLFFFLLLLSRLFLPPLSSSTSYHLYHLYQLFEFRSIGTTLFAKLLIVSLKPLSFFVPVLRPLTHPLTPILPKTQKNSCHPRTICQYCSGASYDEEVKNQVPYQRHLRRRRGLRFGELLWRRRT